ncbi:MAG: hypothetical protein PHI10_03435 [Dehalococcoidales bacterium]|jgi:hypothetical protein|nr:hypothetical protein [Dehalococcoidales bacterium]
MTPKAKKNRKNKRTPVRIITPQTVEMPAEADPVTVKADARPAASNLAPASRQPSTIVQEIKRTGIIAAGILVLLIVLSFIF